jgi:hypothetical protein
VPPGITSPEFVDSGVADLAVHAKLASRKEVVIACVDGPQLERQQLGVTAGLEDGLDRFLEFASLDPVGRQDRNSLALQYVAHERPFTNLVSFKRASAAIRCSRAYSRP